MIRNFISIAAICLVSSSFANLVVNGDFESSAVTSYSVAGQGLAGWTVVGSSAGNNVTVGAANYIIPCTQMLDLSGFSDTMGQGVEQTLATGVGTYTLSFDYFTGNGIFIGPIDVFINNVQVADELNNNPLQSLSTFTMNFNATGPTTIKFLTGNRGWVNHIDNVSVEAVPEPASMTALALGAVAALRRRRSN